MADGSTEAKVEEDTQSNQAQASAAEGQPVHTEAVDTAASGADAVDPSRPTDEQILSYENQIREQQRKQPLLGAREPLDSLKLEYQAGSPVFVTKIETLKKTYHSLRRTRQDGNCFYRSFLFGVLEALVNTRNWGGAKQLIGCVHGWRQKLVDVGYQELVFEDALGLLVELLQSVETATVNELHVRLCDEMVANHIIMFIRLVTSAEIQRRQEHFLPFVLGMSDTYIEIEDFCRRYVECMGEESDHIQLVAAADAFEVRTQVVYLDNSGMGGHDAELACDVHTFGPEESSAGSAAIPKVTLFYRPGHYDILYSS